MEQLTERASANFIQHCRLEVDEDGARDVLAVARLGVERVERLNARTRYSASVNLPTCCW